MALAYECDYCKKLFKNPVSVVDVDFNVKLTVKVNLTDETGRSLDLCGSCIKQFLNKNLNKFDLVMS